MLCFLLHIFSLIWVALFCFWVFCLAFSWFLKKYKLKRLKQFNSTKIILNFVALSSFELLHIALPCFLKTLYVTDGKMELLPLTYTVFLNSLYRKDGSGAYIKLLFLWVSFRRRPRVGLGTSQYFVEENKVSVWSLCLCLVSLCFSFLWFELLSEKIKIKRLKQSNSRKNGTALCCFV